MAPRTVTQSQVVAAIMRTIAKQLIRLAETLEVDADSGSTKAKRRPRTKEYYRALLGD